jgi:hypothetical protein
MNKEINLNLKFSKHIYRIMKQRKNAYIKKKKLKQLSWEDYLKVRILVNKKL